MVSVEGLYIFDEHNNAILEHVYVGRPPPASVLLSAYLSHSAPRPSVIYLPNVNPPTVLYSITQDRLLFFCPVSVDVEPLVVLEFLHRVADALEDFLGAPLLASKVESSYDVVAQIIGEICDAGVIATTEQNALKEVVEAPSWMGNLFGGLGLPSASPSLMTPGLQRPASPFMGGSGGSMSSSAAGSAIPWRRANVRHTSNELYVDIIEELSVIVAPSGRPLSAIANGSIVFTAKISGVPDLLLSLTAPGGRTGMQNAMDLPMFHPCVRLGRWREKPGELSFVPPDGKFVLAGYECNLLPDLFSADSGSIPNPKLDLPVSIETRSVQGTYGDEFEVRMKIKSNLAGGSGSGASASLTRNLGGTGRFGPGGGMAFGTQPSSGPPPIENIVVTVPISSAVRTVEDLKASRGEANFLAAEGLVEWRVSSKEAALIPSSGTTLRFTVTPTNEEADSGAHLNGGPLKTDTFDYDDDIPAVQEDERRPSVSRLPSTESKHARRMQQIATIMPKSAMLSFSMKGWLASGIKVDALTVNSKTSKGLGAGVTPYKGVKYHTISRQGIEVRS